MPGYSKDRKSFQIFRYEHRSYYLPPCYDIFSNILWKYC